jgi:hypothetical protein
VLTRYPAPASPAGTSRQYPLFCMAGPDGYQFAWAALERVI